jgi:hypothetical protein
MPPHRKDRHHVGPFAVAPLQQSKTTRRRKVPSPSNSQRVGASPRPPLDSSTLVHGVTTPATTLTLRARLEDAAKVES